jgi:hypothetical protein
MNAKRELPAKENAIFKNILVSIIAPTFSVMNSQSAHQAHSIAEKL